MTEERRNELLRKLKTMADVVLKFEEAAEREVVDTVRFSLPFLNVINNRIVYKSVRVTSGITELAEAAGSTVETCVSNGYVCHYFKAFGVYFMQEEKIEESKEND